MRILISRRRRLLSFSASPSPLRQCAAAVRLALLPLAACAAAECRASPSATPDQ